MGIYRRTSCSMLLSLRVETELAKRTASFIFKYHLLSTPLSLPLLCLCLYGTIKKGEYSTLKKGVASKGATRLSVTSFLISLILRIIKRESRALPLLCKARGEGAINYLI